jgi:peptidoglycan/LPS O-acetylase OafA/YrhL
MIENGEGVRAARAAKRRYWLMVAISMLGAAGIGLIITTGTTAPGKMTPGFAIAAVLAMLILTPLAIHFSNRATDEVDQMDMLKANSFGLYVYLLGAFSWMLLATGGLMPPPDAMIMFVATALATLARYGMLKLMR